MLTKRNDFWFENPFEMFSSFYGLEKTSNHKNLISDFSKDETSYVYRVTAPGYEEKELQVQVSGNTLTITGKHEKKESEKDKHFVMQSSSFTKHYSLAEDSLPEAATAEYKAGVLVVTLPRSNKLTSITKHIPITSG